MNYVLGFALDSSKPKRVIALIRKNRPRWQAGKLNGIGGKVEAGETYEEAIVREFQEETGVLWKDWKSFAVLTQKSLPEFVVKCFVADMPREVFQKITSKTDERVEFAYETEILHDAVSNLHWLIPMAINSMEDELFEDAVVHYKRNNE